MQLLRGNDGVERILETNRDITERKRAEEALLASERRERERAAELATVLDAVPVPVVIVHDPDSLHMTGNRATDELLRHPRGAEVSVSAPPETRPRHFKPFKDGRELRLDELPAQRAARGEHVQDFEFNLVFDDGTVRDLLAYGTPLLDEQGRPRGAVHVLVDISQRKQAEEALRESEERLRLAMETANMGAWDMNMLTGEVGWSGNHEALFGLEPGTFDGKYETFFARLHPEDRQKVKDEADGCICAKRSRYAQEFRVVWPDGSVHWILAHGHISYDTGGRPVRFIGANFDITKRKGAEEALRESEGQFRELAEGIPQLAWMANPDGWIYWYNQRWYQYTGTTPQQMEGWGWQSVHDPGELPKVLEQWKGSIASGEPFDMVFPLRGADDVFRPFLTRGMPLRDSQGQVVRWFGTNTDINAQKQAEQALLRSEKLASVGRMAASVAHEINNPLAAVMNAVYLASSNLDERELARQYLDVADDELKRIAHITRQTLGFYRESSAPATICVSSIVDSAVDLLRGKIKGKRATIEKRYDGNLQVMAVPGELRQVFSNLLANSLEAIGEEGAIKLRVSKSTCVNSGRPRVRVTVADDGKGIDDDARPHIFEALFTTKESTGSGLGLWVSKQLIDKHSGSIRVRSRSQGPRRGTVVAIFLPA